MNNEVFSELIEMKEMFPAEDDHTAISPNGAEIREPHRFPDGESSFRNDFFWKLGCFRQDMFRAKKTFFRLPHHLGKIKLPLRRKTPGDDSTPPFGQGVDPDLCGDRNRLEPLPLSVPTGWWTS